MGSVCHTCKCYNPEACPTVQVYLLHRSEGWEWDGYERRLFWFLCLFCSAPVPVFHLGSSQSPSCSVG